MFEDRLCGESNREWGALWSREKEGVYSEIPTHPDPLEGAGLCAQGSRKASVARVCLAGEDGTEGGAAGEEKPKGGSWGPGGDHALIQVK